MSEIVSFPGRADEPLLPPHSIDAEQSVLGCLLIHPKGYSNIADWLSPEDFYSRQHQLIFRGIAWLAERGREIDRVTLAEWFEAEGISEAAGGSRYVLELTNTTPSASNLVAYAEIVLERSRLRNAIDVGTRMANSAYARGASSLDVVATAQQELGQLQVTGHVGGLLPAKQLVREWHADLQRRYESKTLPGLPTPWYGLNRRTHGVQPKEVILVAARPNMGKSVLAWQVAAFTAARGLRVAGFSLEMPASSVMRRCVSALESVPHDWLMEPDDHPENWAKVTRGVTALSNGKLWIDDTPRLNAKQIVARAKREHLREPIGLLVVDHVHEMSLPGKQREDIERGDALRDLRGLARELGCPLIAVAQLNRGPATDQGRRPTMADLKNSGGLEEVADVVLLIHREDYYRPGTHMKDVVEIIIGKGRDIKTGTIEYLANRYDCMRLDDWRGDLPAAPSTHAGGAGRDRQLGFEA